MGIDPEKMRQYNVSMGDVVKAVKQSNQDIGAQTLEINQAEYLVRGLGYVKSIADIENAVVDSENFTSIRIKDVANVHLGPAARRGILDKEGAEYVDITIAKRKLALAVSQSYYELYAIRAKQLVLDKNIELLETYERLALTSVEVGKASAVDVLRLQIRQNELVQQKEVLEQDYLAEQTVFNNLLNRDETLEVQVPQELTIPDEEPLVSNENLKLNPELLKYDKLYESVEQSEALNQKESAPNIGFGLDYVPVSERPDMNFSDNGKDIVMPMVSISIPIFNNRYKSITKQNELRQLEITSQKEDRLNRLETLLAQAQYNRNSMKIKFNIQLKNLQQANDAEEILIKNYETGTIDFNDVLDVQELQLKFQINLIESIRGYYTEYAMVNYLTS